MYIACNLLLSVSAVRTTAWVQEQSNLSLQVVSLSKLEMLIKGVVHALIRVRWIIPVIPSGSDSAVILTQGFEEHLF